MIGNSFFVPLHPHIQFLFYKDVVQFYCIPVVFPDSVRAVFLHPRLTAQDEEFILACSQLLFLHELETGVRIIVADQYGCHLFGSDWNCSF
ncbi:MAG: hypothetical protein J6Y97_03660 [Prevotella sp.]|nr:hypothetical protein [Prevotella sp.]